MPAANPGQECLSLIAELVAKGQPLNVVLASQRDASVSWMGSAIHPLQQLENCHQRAVRDAGRGMEDLDERLNNEFEELGKFYGLVSPEPTLITKREEEDQKLVEERLLDVSSVVKQASAEITREQLFLQLRQDGLPSSSLERQALEGTALTQVLTEAGMAGSGKQVKDALGRQAVVINGSAVGMEQNGDPSGCFNPELAAYGRFYLVRLGKKKYHLFELA